MRLSQMYKLLFLLTFIVEQSLGKGNQVMISFSQINANNPTNTPSTVHFRKALGRRKLLGKVGWEKWDRLQVHNSYSAGLWLLLVYIQYYFAVHLSGLIHKWFDQFLPLVYTSSLVPAVLPVMETLVTSSIPSPPGHGPPAIIGVSLAAWGCSCSSPQSHQPSLSEVSTWRMSSPIPMSSCQGFLGKEHLTWTPRAALFPPCLGDNGWPLSRWY